MASTKTSLTNPQQKTDMVPEHEQPSFLQDFHNLIQRRAYDLFVHEGHVEGNALEHWLQAEDEFLIHPAIHEADGTFTLKVSLPAKSADRVKVFSDETRAVISADTAREEMLTDGTATAESAAAYYSVRWPDRVDPNTATAQFHEGLLTLTARKAASGESAATSAPTTPPTIASTGANEKGKSAAAGTTETIGESSTNPKA